MIRIMDFKTEYKGDAAVDWVLIGPMGEAIERTQTWQRIDKIRPPNHVDENSPSMMAMKARWDQIEPAYRAWKSGSDVPDDGMPLGAWSGVTTAQADLLRKMGFTTVEKVTLMKEADIAKLPFPGARKLPEMAREYLEGKDKADLLAQNQALAEKLAQLEEALNAQAPKRGRPRKTEEEAA